jgi:hypothetical protein
MNRNFLPAAAAILLASAQSAASATPKAEAVRLIAEAAAWGGLCVNWGLDRQAADAFLRSHKVAIRGDYRAVYGFAYSSAHAQAMAWRNSPNACDAALDRYGPYGRVLPGMLRPVWDGLQPFPFVF